MTIAKRIYLLILFAGMMMTVLISVELYQTTQVFQAASISSENVIPSMKHLNIATTSLGDIRRTYWHSLAISDPTKKQKLHEEILVSRSVITDALDEYEKHDIYDDQDRALLEADRSQMSTYYTIVDKVLLLDSQGKSEEAIAEIARQQPILKKIYQALEAHIDYNVNLNQRIAKEAHSTLVMAYWVSSGIGLLTLIGMTIIGVKLARQLVSSLNDAIKVTVAVAEGDLTQNIEVTGQDEISQLMGSVKGMASNLETICMAIRQGTNAIARASSEIASGNVDLSTRTEQQAGALETTASSMEELTSTVKQNSENARQANALANAASEVAVEGGTVVSKVVDTMAAINDSSRKIVDIISVIDGIAFQTNILALNAAVEAARAGEQGRGFAVVAAEVRNLAQRSGSAAKEIKALIDNSVEKVDSGTKLVDQAGEAMVKIVNSIQKVSDVVGEISNASDEQSAGIDQIHQAVIQMDETTQQNAALVEEAAAAALALKDQAAHLMDVVSVFKLRDSGSWSSDNNRHSISSHQHHEHSAAHRNQSQYKSKKVIKPAPQKNTSSHVTAPSLQVIKVDGGLE